MLGDFKVNVLFTTAVSLLIWAFMVVEKTLYGIINLHYDVVLGSGCEINVWWRTSLEYADYKTR